MSSLHSADGLAMLVFTTNSDWHPFAMKNIESWTPSKFEMVNGVLQGSRNRKQVALGSRLMADCLARFFQRAIPRHAQGRLLDLGCGAVPLFATYRDHVTDIVCVDWDNGSHANHYLDLAHDLTKPLPYGDGSFETILLSDVLEHIPEPEKVWSEMNRILASGGKAIVTVPFYYWLHERPHDFYRYTEFALRRFCDRFGFEILAFERLGGAPEIFVDMITKVLANYRLGRHLAPCAQSIGGWLARTAMGRKLSIQTSARFPFGYAMVVEKRA